MANSTDWSVRDEWRSQGSVDTLSAQFVGRFKLLWTDAREMTMAACAIVERIDVIGHVG